MTTYNFTHKGRGDWYIRNENTGDTELVDRMVSDPTILDGVMFDLDIMEIDDVYIPYETIRLYNVRPSDTFNITNNSSDTIILVKIESALPIINFHNNGAGIKCKVYPQKSNEDYKNAKQWNVTGLTNADYMFRGCKNFNQPLNNWDVSNVYDMFEMFRDCTDFNQPLNNWDVSCVEYFSGMFFDCKNFDQPLNNWDVSNVAESIFMFGNCKSFDQPLDKWNVSNITNMSWMFRGCVSFTKSLHNWSISPDAKISGTFDYRFDNES